MHLKQSGHYCNINKLIGSDALFSMYLFSRRLQDDGNTGITVFYKAMRHSAPLKIPTGYKIKLLTNECRSLRSAGDRTGVHDFDMVLAFATWMLRLRNLSLLG